MRFLLPLALLSSTPALAESRVLVLPLAGTGAPEGLGEALSVWLTEDLGRAPTLEAVDRAEVEVQMPTGRSAPLTLDLDFAITGSWTVLGDELSLVATVGATEARARGPKADFVLLEQQLVAQLAAALSAEVPSTTVPTERLDALAAWGRGLEARRAKQMTEARAAFAEAIAADPAFERARQDLARSQATGAERRTHAMTPAQDAVLAAHPPLDRAPANLDELAGFALRLMVLENEGRHCDRLAEMTAYLDRVHHQVALPSGVTDAALSTAVATEARSLGFTAVPRTVTDLPEAAYAMPQRRAAGQFATTADFLFREASARNTAGQGLFGALVQCRDGAEAQAELARIGALAMAQNQADQIQLGRPAPGWTLRESLELGWAWIQANQLGPSAELDRRLDALTSVRDPSDPVVQQMLDRARDLRSTAATAHAPKVAAAPDSAVVAKVRGAADGAVNVVTDAPWACKHTLESAKGTYYAWVSQLGTASMEDPRVARAHMAQGSAYVATLTELGCLVGTSPAHADPAAVHTSLSDRLDRMPPGVLSRSGCGPRVAALRKALAGDPTSVASAVGWLQQYHDLAAFGCSAEP